MLTIGIDTKKKEPIYEQIYKYIRKEIKKGALTCGTKLPSSRKLAEHLDVSRNTIDLAYSQLLSEGYIESKPKRGYFVAEVDEILDFADEIPEEDDVIEKKELLPYEFAPSGVDMAHFPYNTWRRLMREVLMGDNSEIFQTGNSSGDYELRDAIRIYLHQSRGVICRSSQIILGSGMEYLILLLAQILGTDYVVGMENPTYMQAYRVFSQLGFDVHGISMDEMGMKVDDLLKSNVQIAYVTPSHQYPTGTVMPISRRNALLKWASEKENRFIIEDDYDSEFRYHGKPIPALQGNDKNGKVIYMGTFSKAIAPAIRVGYMVLPKELLAIYQEKISFYSCTVSRIDQAILSEFIRGGHFERHLNRMRALYKGKNQYLMQQLKLFGDDAVISGASAGLHVLVEFKDLADHELFEKTLYEKGVKIQRISSYYITGKPEKECYILGFARLKESQIKQGILIIKDIYDKFRIRKEE
ncbi:MAG: PLP-dependent aminotransferase family protein [Lachnospiraceae bacterium]|nr:PLP-dependent aminotransferase family protein [Lachnospiraceae bacterium]